MAKIALPTPAIYKNVILSPSTVDYQKLEIAGSIFDSTGNVILEARRHTNGIWRYLESDTWNGEEPSHQIPSGIYLGHMFDHFGHFLIETLPQLIFYNAKYDNVFFHGFPDRITLDTLKESAYIPFFLDAAGIALEKIHLVRQSTLVKSLAIAPRSFLVRGIMPWSIARFIQSTVQHVEEREGYEQVFFTRSGLGAGARKVDFEHVLEEFFVEHGFKIVSPEKLSIEEQISIAKSCRVMAGVDGSAMHLGMFMKSGGHSIIFNSRNRQQAFTSVNELAGVETHWLDVQDGETQSHKDPLQRVQSALGHIGIAALGSGHDQRMRTHHRRSQLE